MGIWMASGPGLTQCHQPLVERLMQSIWRKHVTVCESESQSLMLISMISATSQMTSSRHNEGARQRV